MKAGYERDELNLLRGGGLAMVHYFVTVGRLEEGRVGLGGGDLGYGEGLASDLRGFDY